MNGIKREQFKMTKVKILNGGGIHYEADITMQDGGDTHTVKRKDDITIIPAESLTQPIRDLKEKLLYSCEYMGMRSVVNHGNFHAKKDQKDAVEKYIDVLKSKTTVYQVSVSGQDKNEGVIITAKIQALNSSVIAINSPRMRYGVSTFGFEEDLHEIVTLIEDELFEYLYNGKKMHLEAFDPKEQKGEKKAGTLPLEEKEQLG